MQSLISLYNKLQNYGEMIKSIFKNSSVREAIDNTEIPNEDPFKHLSEYKHTLWKKRNYLNFLNCKSYGIPFFIHFSCLIFFRLTTTSEIRPKKTSKFFCP